MCDCFHLAFPNWQAASSGTGAGRRLRAPEDDSTCDEPSQFTERPRPQGSSPVEEYPETEKYSDSDKECEAEHDPHHKRGSGKKTKKSGLGSMFEKRSTSKMSKLKEDHCPESGVIVKTAKGGCAEGLVYGGGGKEGIFIKEVVPESPASKSLELKEGDQLLSATVYFDNVSYEDAIQILEHSQAYKVKLCLKRKPDVTETESAIESDVIPEEDVYAPEMREQGKTKRRAEARISWPKFPSFGKGRKSRFTRSHSSSEADEQKKLELSPTTSDTESPIKSQDALKGKKKHKIKLSGLKKRGRVSSSEDQDTDAPASAQMASPECLESPSGETPQVYVTEDPNEVEDVRLDQELTEVQSVSHKVELITIASSWKTEDLTMALTGQEDSSGIKSPDGKKNKRELSQLKMKILGKDKSHKKDTKAKSSPKRLRTLGGSVEKADKPEIGKSESHTKLLGNQLDANNQVIKMSVSQGELEISNVALIQKSPQKGSEKTKKGKDVKPKQETKKDPTFKLPKIGFRDIASEETITKVNAEDQEDPYQQLTKRIPRTKLPKREDIEIPGMEDMSKRTRPKKMKEPKTVFTGHHEDIQAESVQMLIDVDRVKEAVSKLPGFKLPKVDTSGMPIPEEITVIDANAQRISVKTPTKTKHDAHLSKFEVTGSPDFSKTTMKLPKIRPDYLASEEILTVTQVDSKKPGKEYKAEPNRKSDEEVYKREHIIIPGKETAQEKAILQTQETQGQEGIKSEYTSAATFKTKREIVTMPSFGITKPDIKIPDVGIYLPKQNISEQKVDNIMGERTIFLQGEETPKTETRNEIEGVPLDVKIPEMEGIEYIDSVEGSPVIKDGGVKLSGFGVNLNAHIPCPDVGGEVKVDEASKETFKLPEIEEGTPDISVNVPHANEDINIDEAELKTLKMGGKSVEFDLPNLCISMPEVKEPKIDSSLSKKDVDFTKNLGITVEGKTPEIYEQDIKISTSKFRKPTVEVSTPNMFVEVSDTNKDVKIDRADIDRPAVNIESPSVEIEGQSIDSKAIGPDQEGKGSKFKMPHLRFSMPKVIGPQINLSSTKKDVDVTLSETSAEIKLPKSPQIDAGHGKEVLIPEMKVQVKKSDLEMKPLQSDVEIDMQGSKFKMPKLGMSMPKVQGPEITFGLSRKDLDVMPAEPKIEVKVPEVEMKEPTAKVEIKSPEKSTEISPSQFKMPMFKLPKIAVGTPNLSVEVPEMDKYVKIDGAAMDIPEEGSAINIAAPSIDIEGPSMDMKTTGAEQEDIGSKNKMPHLGFSMPKVRGQKIDSSLPEKDNVDAKVELGKVDVSIPEAKMDIIRPDMEMHFVQTDDELDGREERLKIPKFGIKMPKVKGPEFDSSSSKKDMNVPHQPITVGVKHPEAPKIHASLGKAEVLIQGAKMEDKNPEMEINPLQTGSELEGHRGKFQMPKFGITKVKGPEIDLSFSKKYVDVTLPQAESEVKLPEAPKIAVDMKPAECEAEIDGQGGKFKMPRFGISMPGIKGPKIDLSSSKKDVDISLPEAKGKVNLPHVELQEMSTEVEIKAPGTETQTSSVKESTSKFKLPTFKFPKFGAASNLSTEIPEIDKEITIDGAELDFPAPRTDVDEPGVKAEVHLPKLHVKIPSAGVVIEQPCVEVDAKQKKNRFSLRGFSFSKTSVKAPEVDANLQDFNAPIPEGNVEVNREELELPEKEPQVEIKAPKLKIETKGTEGSPSKYKMPTLKLPKFGFGSPSAIIDVTNKEVNIDRAEIETPDEVLAVEIAAPSIDIKDPSIYFKTTGTELDGKESKFKLPSLSFSGPQIKHPDIDLSLSKKDADVTLPEAKADVKLPHFQLKGTSAIGEIEPPEIKDGTKGTEESPSKFKMTTYKLPKFGVGIPSATIEVPDKEVIIDGADVKIPEIDIEAFTTDIKDPSIELAKGSKFELPGFGFSGPQIKQPDIDLSLSMKDADVTLPEAKGDVKLPDVELKEMSSEVEIKAPQIKIGIKARDGSPSKFKIPTLLDVAAPGIDIDDPSIEIEGKGSKFQLPSLSFSGPQIKRPDIDLSLSKKNVDVTLPDPETDVKLPDVELKETSAEVEINAPEIKIGTTGTDGSPSKVKMPTLKLPKFGVGTPRATIEVPDLDGDINIDGADIKIPKEVLAVEVAAPSIDIEDPSIELEGKGSKFKLPSLSFSGPQIKRPDIVLSLSKKNVDVTLPDPQADVKVPDVELKETSAEVEINAPEIKIGTTGTDGSPSKFKMPTFKLPKFGFGTPSATIDMPDKDVKIEGADIDISKQVPGIDIAAPTIDIKDPSIELEAKGSKFKLPGFGFSGPQTKQPEIDLSLSKKYVDVTVTEAKGDFKLPDVELKENSAEVEIKDPEIKIGTTGTDGSPSKFKMPTFKLPKFGFGTPSATIEMPDKDVKNERADIDISKQVPEIDIEAPTIDIKDPSIDLEAKGSKFKLPGFGFSGPQIKQPDIDLSLSKKDVDVTIPEAKGNVKLPDVELKENSAEVEIKAPEIKIVTKGGSPSKFKMPTFKLPKFGVGTPHATIEAPDLDEDINVDGADVIIPEEVLAVEVASPNIGIDDTAIELDGKGRKFKLPSLSFSGPQIKRPEIDLSLSKKNVDVTLPDPQADVKLPDVELKETSAEVEINAPEIKIGTTGTDGSPSKFKMPTFKLPKFGVGTPRPTIEGPDLDGDINIDGADIKIPKEVLAVEVAAPSIDIEDPSIELEGKGSKFKLPSLSFSGPQIKRPEIDLSSSKKNVDVTVSDPQADVKLPDVEMKETSAEVEINAPEIKIRTRGTDGSPSKFKMPTFKLPKFGFGTPSATIEMPDKDVKIEGADIDISKQVPEIDIAAPHIDIEDPSIEQEVKGSKFRLPGFGFSGPQIKQPDIDLSLSKKGVDVTVPEAKGNVKLPDVEMKENSAEVEIKAPEIKIVTKGGSPSKFKMPTFKLPKFGVGTPRATIEAPDLDEDINVDGADVKIPEEVLAVEVASPSIGIEDTAIEHDGKGRKFKLPSLSFSGPQMKRPDIDLSLSMKDVDVTLPEAKGDVKLPDVELKETPSEVEIKAPQIKIGTKATDGSPSKFKMPTFKLPNFGVGTPRATIEAPNLHGDINIDGGDVKIPEEVLADIKEDGANLKLPEVKAEVIPLVVENNEPLGSISVLEAEMIEGDAKLKKTGWTMPKFSFSKTSMKGPEGDVNLDAPKDDVTLPAAKMEVHLPDIDIEESSGISIEGAPATELDSKLKKSRFSLPKFSFSKQSAKEFEFDVSLPVTDVEVKQPEEELSPPEGDAELERQESKFKMPKFGISMPKVKGPEIDLSLLNKAVDVTLPNAKAEAQLPDARIKHASATMEIKTPEIEAPTGNVEGSPSKLKMPKFTLPKFGDATSKVSVDVPDVDKKIKIGGGTVEGTTPNIDGLSVDVKAEGSEVGGSGSKFKMPKFGISMSKVKGPEIDLSLLKKDVDVTLPEAKAEVKLPSVEVKEPEAFISASDSPTVEVETKMKRSNWTFPTFSFSKTGGKIPDEDVDLEKPKVDVTSTEAKADVPQPSGEILMEEPSVAEPDANLQKNKFSLPRFSFSKSSVKAPQVSAELPCVDISLPEGQVIVKQPEMHIKAPAIESELDEQGSKFKFPKFGIALPKAKGPGEELKTFQEDAVISLPEVKAEVKFPQTEVKVPSATGEMKASEVKSKDVEGSSMKFKLSALKMPKFGAATYDVTVEAPNAEKVAETDVVKLKEDVTVDIKGLSSDIKSDVHPAAITDSETPKIETDAVGLGSPSKFKLPSFKMPKLSFSRNNPEDEHVPVHIESKEDQQEMKVEPKEERKSPKVTFALSEVLKNVDVEYDVPKTSENLETSKEVHETDEPSGKREETRGKVTKQDPAKSPEKTGWFKFPKFGLSSPSEPARTSERDKKSPEGETLDEEISPTCSVQSSDAFADISSAMTSEHVGLSSSSPTKVTVKYSDPDTTARLRETHGNIITSTARAELISVEPNLPEKITILSSGVSSSSEDTLRLKSGNIHVITSNIQATPEAQRAKLLTAVQMQSAGGLPRGHGPDEGPPRATEGSHGGKKTVFERHFVTETSCETSKSKETIVITKQITRRFDSPEPISGETASSVQRLRDSVHSDKMRFFDGATE
ncbi:neuroblast differentiation-associated protein AHNAK-like [Pungitius pungitius]|uniref:neuroblast differentiation-associated protein AHNAK-like n=1 Tax=Pungitius pungitius TaxID=134920 RepID=UPI002E0D5242